MNVGWVGWVGIGMGNESGSGSGARCEKEVEYKKNAFPNLHLRFLLMAAWPYIYMYTRASAYARGLLGEIIHPYLRCKWAPSCCLK